MKVIFDNEDQKKSFMEHIASDYCPSIFGLENFGCDYGRNCDCDVCWDSIGLLEVAYEN